MKKKCLGCGKVFEDTINICQDCFQAIEKVRGEMDDLPPDFSKKKLLKWRKTLLLGCLVLISTFISSVFVCTYVFWRINLFLPPILILTLFLSAVFFLSIGLYLGMFFNKIVIKWLIGIFLTKEGYLGGIRRINRRLHAVPCLFSMVAGIIAIKLLSPLFYQSNKFSFSYIIFSVIMLVGGCVCSIGFYIGLLINHYLSTDWMKKLNK